MKIHFALVAMTGLALVGCNRGAANNSAANNSSAANASANAAAPAAAATGAPVDQAFLLGHWSPAPDCSQTMSFNADGTAQATGNPDARWKLEGGAVTAETAGKPPARTPVSRNGDKLVLTGPQGQTVELTRCQSAAADAPAGSVDTMNEAAEAEETSE